MRQKPSEEMGGRISDSVIQRETLLNGVETAQMAEHTRICMCKVGRLGGGWGESGTGESAEVRRCGGFFSRRPD